jgi:hypothetical protein
MQTFNISYSVFKSAATVLSVYYVEKVNGSYFAAGGNNGILYVSNITDSGDITDFETDIKPGATSVVTEDDAMASALLSELFVTQRYDMSDDTVVYVGTAVAGTANNAIGWTIKKTTIVAGVATETKVTAKAVAIWNDRLTETYY